MPSPSLDRHPFGHTPAGESVELFTLANGHGIVVELLSYGGIVRRILAPDRDGTVANIVLGLASLDDYVHRNSPHFGALTGRLANRLADAAFVLDGVRHEVDRNDGPNSLHGGSRGFGRQVWRPDELLTTPTSSTVVLGRTSAAGEMGFPGALDRARRVHAHERRRPADRVHRADRRTHRA